MLVRFVVVMVATMSASVFGFGEFYMSSVWALRTRRMVRALTENSLIQLHFRGRKTSKAAERHTSSYLKWCNLCSGCVRG